MKAITTKFHAKATQKFTLLRPDKSTPGDVQSTGSGETEILAAQDAIVNYLRHNAAGWKVESAEFNQAANGGKGAYEVRGLSHGERLTFLVAK